MALEFNGSDNHIIISSSADTDYGTGAFAVVFLVRCIAVDRINILYSHGGSNQAKGTGGVIAISGSGGDNYLKYYCSGFRIRGTTNIVADTWYYVAMVGNGGANGSRTIKLYLDETQEGSTFTYDYDFGQENLWIGANEDLPAECIDGNIADARVYKRELSLVERQSIYNTRGSDNIVNGLVGRWLMNELSSGSVATGAGSVKDISPAGNHGTAANSPIYRQAPMRLYKPQILI